MIARQYLQTTLWAPVVFMVFVLLIQALAPRPTLRKGATIQLEAERGDPAELGSSLGLALERRGFVVLENDAFNKIEKPADRSARVSSEPSIADQPSHSLSYTYSLGYEGYTQCRLINRTTQRTEFVYERRDGLVLNAVIECAGAIERVAR